MGFKGVHITRTCFPDEKGHGNVLMRVQLHVKRVLKACSDTQKGHFKMDNDMLGREWGSHLNTIHVVIHLNTNNFTLHVDKLCFENFCKLILPGIQIFKCMLINNSIDVIWGINYCH